MSLLWSTPIISPRPMRMMVSTGFSSSSQIYITLISALAVPKGVAMMGSKFKRSCRM